MDAAEVVVGSGSRSSFRKPSNDFSQRNYRRRSRSSSRHSSSPSSPPQAGWKRDRSASPTSPTRNFSSQSKNGRKSHSRKYESNEDGDGRRGESERHLRVASHDRNVKRDLFEPRRSSPPPHQDRHYQASTRRTSRIDHGASRGSGSHEHLPRKRETPERGVTDSTRSRDLERSRSTDPDRGVDVHNARRRSEGRGKDYSKDSAMEGRMEQERSKVWDRDTDRNRDRVRNRVREQSDGRPTSSKVWDRDIDRNRDRVRNRIREQSEGRSSSREMHLEDDEGRVHERDLSRDSVIDRDRRGEHGKYRQTIGDTSLGKYLETGKRDSLMSRESKRESKSVGKDYKNVTQLDRISRESRGDVGYESERERYRDKKGISGLNCDEDMETQTVDRNKEIGVKVRHRDRAEDGEVANFSSVPMDTEKDDDERRDRGSNTNPLRDRDESKNEEIAKPGDKSDARKAVKSRDKETRWTDGDKDLVAAKLGAMKAAELVNRNLGITGFMSADQKKQLLWGSKKLVAEQESVDTAGVNRWDTVHFSDPDRREKFQKLMGVKADNSTQPKVDGGKDVGLFTEERQREMEQDLEKQFAAGLRRRDGGKVGLGL